MAESAVKSAVIDPYQLDPAAVIEPPRSLLNALRRIGPGMILSASIVGSGELIATTVLGARVGFVALWIIILSCLIKPAVQSEFGRFVIATGRTGLEALDSVPGPRIKVNWAVWIWAAVVLLSQFQVGAMYGGVGQVLHTLVPVIPVDAWVAVEMGVTLALLLGGGYGRIETLATIKVALFTMLTFLCALILIRLPQYFNWSLVADGLKFNLPPTGLAGAIAVFGITGVGTTELAMYPYWCVEKGYARYAGPADVPGWRDRVVGWVRVMNLDIVCSMIIYCIATAAFYFLGAGILHSQGLVPQSTETVAVLSKMYTQTLGEWSLPLFYVGAVATLYGTVFAATAAHSRLFSDMARMFGSYERTDYASRLRYRDRFVWMLVVIPGCLYWIFQEPVWMVTAGGIAQALGLPVFALAILYLRHRRLPEAVRPNALVTLGLWFVTTVIVFVTVFYLTRLVFSI